MGRTECNRIVNFAGGPNQARLLGQMLDVVITQAFPHSLRGSLVLTEGTPLASPFNDPARSPATTG
jgi:tRNA-2-methylthio-N6-dimethylallyladenosine synthase